MQRMVHLINRKNIGRALVFLMFIFFVVGFSSCGTVSGAKGSTAGAEGTSRAGVASGSNTGAQANRASQASLKINFVDTVTYSFRPSEIQLFHYSEEKLYILELPSERNRVYRQIWDEDSLSFLYDAILRFSADESGGKLGTADSRSFTAYGTTEGKIEWPVSTSDRNIMSAEPSIDVGYIIKDGAMYLLITQRDVPLTEDPTGRLRSSRIIFCMGMDQARYMLNFFGMELFERPLLVFLGDGVTAGTDAIVPDEDDPASAYPAILQERLKIAIINSGVSWETTADALERIGDILKYDPEIVVINLGYMDFLSEVNPTETNKNLQSIIDALKKEGNRKIYLTRFYDEFILRTYMTDTEKTAREQDNLIANYDGIFRNLSRVNNIELITGIWDGLQYDDTIAEDYIHPTAEGHKIMAGNFFRALLPYLQTNGFLR